METHKKRIKFGIASGVILILLGSLLVARNLNLLSADFNKIVISWPMLLIVIGIFSLVKRRIFQGFFLLCAGIFFIIPRVAKVFPDMFGEIGVNFARVYWPVLLIVVGVALILHWICIPKNPCCRHWHSHSTKKPNPDSHFQWDNSRFEQDENRKGTDFSKTSVFGNGKYIVVDTEFKGGTLKAVFGGIELDLRKAYLPEGDTYLNIEAVFGGISLFV
ncbi:MAG: DUF5668 domain-containing protein, partial [Prevotellaceae bacterium]|nr:DUF5668 domain-containing protein [Prevotellaceae bacterium]